MVEVKNVSIEFTMYKNKVNSLKELFVRKVKNNLEKQKFVAVNNISFNIKKGEVFGLVGLNGSGKSTLLKAIAGVYKPTKGSVVIHGNIAPLIELGAGFDPELSARENIFLNGHVLGFSTNFIKEKFDEIVDFSELHEFLDVPIQNYSSGMVARIAFGIATCIQPDILIADEILSVGDFAFQKKCEDRIQSMIKNGTTVIFVSHSTDQVKKLCNRCAWLEKGNLKMIGDAEEVCNAYAGV